MRLLLGDRTGVQRKVQRAEQEKSRVYGNHEPSVLMSGAGQSSMING